MQYSARSTDTNSALIDEIVMMLRKEEDFCVDHAMRDLLRQEKRASEIDRHDLVVALGRHLQEVVSHLY